MENQEEIHDILTLFEKKPSTDIPPVLEEYLKTVAKTGKTLFPWSRLKMLFITKVEQVMDSFNRDVPYDHLPPFPNVEHSKYAEMQKRITESMHKFTGAPFTVQRICELVTQPRKHYTRCDKFLRGIEKNVMVVSSVDPSGRKIVSESSHSLVNGMDTNGFNQKQDLNDFTEGQPFGQIYQSSWSNNNAASMWPAPVIQDSSEDPEHKLSDHTEEENSASNHNTNSPLNVPTGSDSVTDSDKFNEDHPTAASKNSTNTTSPEFSALFHEKPLEGESLEEGEIKSRVGPASQSGPPEPSTLREEIGPQLDEAVLSDSCEKDADSEESSASVEESKEEHGTSTQEEMAVGQDKEVPPDTSCDDGPPEKKMRLSEEATDSSSGTSDEVNSQQEDVKSTKSPEQAADEPQSSCDESEQEVTESSNVSTESVQESRADEVSQSDNHEAKSPARDSASDDPATITTTTAEEDQSAVTSTEEDNKQSQSTENGADETDEKKDNSAEAETKAKAETENEAETITDPEKVKQETEAEIEAETTQESSGNGENEALASTDDTTAEIKGEEITEETQEAESSSGGEMMETDAAEVTGEKTEEADAESTTEESEPMEQE